MSQCHSVVVPNVSHILYIQSLILIFILFLHFQRVGCDLRIGSSKKVDACGVCGGNGSTCSQPMYQWDMAPMSLCSTTCGGGKFNRTFFSPLFSAFVLFVFFNLLWPNSIYLFVQIFGIHFHLLHIVQVFKTNLNVFSPILLPGWFQKKLVLLIKIPIHAHGSIHLKKKSNFSIVNSDP